MKPRLTDADYERAAAVLDCDVPAVKAIAEVESAGDGFLSDGRVKVLFETAQFHKRTAGRFAVKRPDLSQPTWEGARKFYTKGATADERGAGELKRLADAMELDRGAALASTSFGKFQIMGFNHRLCGHADIEAFYTAIQISEARQLDAFCEFVAFNAGMHAALKAHAWAGFARAYNGPKYAENQYDLKRAKAWAKHGGKP